MAYNLYTVTYSFEAPGEYADNRIRETYVVVGRTAEEAKEKTHKKFVQTPIYHDLRLDREGLVRTSVRQVGNKKIQFPSLSLAEDRDQFEIGVEVSEDKKSLEFLVREK